MHLVTTITVERRRGLDGRAGTFDVDLDVSGDVIVERDGSGREGVAIDLDTETEALLQTDEERELALDALADKWGDQ